MTRKIWSFLDRIARTKAPLIRHSKHTACVVHKGKIISLGMAKYKTHPMMVKYQENPERIYLHAEIDALIKVINKYGVEILTESELYVLRLSKGGTQSNSQPCEGCTKALKAFGVREVYWSN